MYAQIKRGTLRCVCVPMGLIVLLVLQIYFCFVTRGIWKVLSMVLYLSNRFTNPIMCGIILKNYLSSMLWHKFNELIIMRTQKYYCEYMYCLYTGKRKISVEIIYYILPFEKYAEHY